MEVQDKSQIALAHESIASVHGQQERYPEALMHYAESYRINAALGEQVRQAHNKTSGHTLDDDGEGAEGEIRRHHRGSAELPIASAKLTVNGQDKGEVCAPNPANCTIKISKK